MSTDDKTRISPAMASTNVGTQLSGIFELDERIAFGGMGEVYRGHNIQTGEHVAIKIVLPEFARDETILSLFKKEAKILNRLSHDAIVRYHVFTVDPGIGRPYLAMEFVDGESLFDLMQRGPMAVEDVRKLCHRLASGLSAVHDAGAVHRDLSPDNVILPGGQVERAKIIDFGIARSATVGGETLIGGKFAGKYNYVSPEQLGLYSGEVTERSDVYSLGLVLAAALRGKPIEMSGSQFEVVEKRRTIPDLSDIDGDFRPVVEAMLRPDPQDRPTSAEIAWMTREDGLDDFSGPINTGSIHPRDQQNAGSIPPRSGGGSTPPSRLNDKTGFVPHVPPAHLSKPRPAPGPLSGTPQSKRAPAGKTVPIAAVMVLAVAATAGAYFGGFLPPWSQPAGTDAGETAKLTPEIAPAPQPDPATDQAAGGEPSAAAPIPAPPVDQPEPANGAGRGADKPAPEPENSPTQAETAPTPDKPAPANQQTEAKAPAANELPPKEETVATVIPKPDAPAIEPVENLAERISWLRDYRGGDCFYANATSAPGKALTIDGFGTAAKPFDQMLDAFQAKFETRPEVNVSLVEPAQCGVATFLQALAATAPERPILSLDQTSVPNGAPVSGTMETVAGQKTSLFLIDHKGMVFNLGERIRAQPGKATFSIPLGLGAVDRNAGQPLPQLMVALTGNADIQAARFSRPTPAATLFPKILAEIEGKRANFSATAKSFRLGG